MRLIRGHSASASRTCTSPRAAPDSPRAANDWPDSEVAIAMPAGCGCGAIGTVCGVNEAAEGASGGLATSLPVITWRANCDAAAPAAAPAKAGKVSPRDLLLSSPRRRRSVPPGRYYRRRDLALVSARHAWAFAQAPSRLRLTRAIALCPPTGRGGVPLAPPDSTSYVDEIVAAAGLAAAVGRFVCASVAIHFFCESDRSGFYARSFSGVRD